jgi:hypothetical protein
MLERTAHRNEAVALALRELSHCEGRRFAKDRKQKVIAIDAEAYFKELKHRNQRVNVNRCPAMR